MRVLGVEGTHEGAGQAVDQANHERLQEIPMNSTLSAPLGDVQGKADETL
jgi:hypothetical protein